MSTPEVQVGFQLPPLVLRFTRADLVRYAGASTDFNPIHYSERAAAAVGLPGVIAHGMLTMGSALRVVTDWVDDPSRVRSYFVRFTRPVVVPDDDEGVQVAFTGTVSAVDGDLVTVALDAVCGDQKVLGAARAEVDLGPGAAASPTATSPTATSPTATSPTATSPTATSPTATSPTATSPTAAAP